MNESFHNDLKKRVDKIISEKGLIFNQKRFEKLTNDWYNYKDFKCLEDTTEYYYNLKAKEAFLNVST